MKDNLDTQIDIYRDAEHESCEVCMVQDEDWEKSVIDEDINYSITIDEKIYGFK